MAVINGTASGDSLLGTTDADQINGLDGNDTINAATRVLGIPGGLIDVIDGGSGIDTLLVDASSDSQGVQLSTGLSPRFAVRSTSGAFYVDAYGFELVKFTGGGGDDRIDTGDSGGALDGGGGIDWWLADLSGLSTNVAFTLGTTTKVTAAGLTSILGIERLSLVSGTGNDSLVGGSQADYLATGDGDDTVDARTRPVAGGIDVVDGGAGTDTLVVDASGESQAVSLGVGFSPSYTVSSVSGNFAVEAYSIEKVKFTGGTGDDTINTGVAGGTVNGGAGIDYWIADLGDVVANLTFVLGTTTALAPAGLTSILGIERISLTTGSGNDAVTGGARADLIATGSGNDTIDARSSGGGIDIADGGAGTDTLVVDASAEVQGVTLTTGLSPSFSVSSVSGNFAVQAYAMEKVKFTGGAGDDSIDTGTGGVTVDGGGGSDRWIADLGDLTADVSFALGTTTAIAAAGLTSIQRIERLWLTTGSGDDVISGGAEADWIRTGEGDDVIDARTRLPGGALDIVDGGAGTDLLVVDASSETDAVTLSTGLSPAYSVSSVSGRFAIEAYSVERVSIVGGSGNDTFDTGAGAVAIDGGGGIDRWIANLSEMTRPVNFVLGTTTELAAARITSIQGIERISLTTGSGRDSIVAGALADFVSTGGGDDSIDLRTTSGGAVEIADGGRGTDTLIVDASAETQAVTLSSALSPRYTVSSVSNNFRIEAYAIEKVKITGGSGDDTLDTAAGGVTVDGGAGSDLWIANLSQLTADVNFTLGTTNAIAAAGLTSIKGIERLSLVTGSGDDAIAGGSLADSIQTGAGADTIDMRKCISGIDIADGGRGIDTLVVDASSESQSVFLSGGLSPSFTLSSLSSQFRAEAYNVERAVFSGGSAGDSASGNRWNDVLNGRSGDDTLLGGDGDDTLDGGAGLDYLRGGRGADLLTGSGGRDVFDYDLATDSSVPLGLVDTIADFVSGQDTIDLSGIDANARTVDGNQAFALIGAAQFSGARGELRTLAGLVEGDLNGDTVADFRLVLANGATAAATDFVL